MKSHSVALNKIVHGLVILAVTLFMANPAMAFEPVMDYWFIEHYTVSQVDLPQGVTISINEPVTSPRHWLIVENVNEQPLYVMSLNYKDVLVMVTPDPGWKTRVTLAHEAAAYLVAPERPAALNINALADLDHNLADRNVLTNDSPPPDLTVPAEQNSELLLVYDSQVFEVPFKITYTVNTNYNNGSRLYWEMMTSIQATTDASATATQQAMVSTARTKNTSIVLGLTGVAVMLIVGWVAWKGLVRRGQDF